VMTSPARISWRDRLSSKREAKLSVLGDVVAVAIDIEIVENPMPAETARRVR
jgi:hypothetical protein